MIHQENAPNYWLTHRVSYGETDTMGVVYYAEYLHFFERARNELIRSLGMSYATVEERGYYLPVREAQCRYRLPARYDDLIWVHARAELGRASMLFQYEIFDETKTKVLTEGFTKHAWVNKEGKPVPAPDFMRALLQNAGQ